MQVLLYGFQLAPFTLPVLRVCSLMQIIVTHIVLTRPCIRKASQPDEIFCRSVLEVARKDVDGDPDENMKLLPAHIEELKKLGHYADLTTTGKSGMKEVYLNNAKSDFKLATKAANDLATKSKLPAVLPLWDDYAPDYSEIDGDPDDANYFESWTLGPSTSKNQMENGWLSHVQAMDAGHDKSKGDCK